MYYSTDSIQKYKLAFNLLLLKVFERIRALTDEGFF